LTTGLIGTKYLFPALTDFGGPGGVDVALNLLKNYESPSYGYMRDQGPGTLWESWAGNNSYHRPRGSLNHIMLGSQLPWFHTHLAGIQQHDDSIGWNKILFAPALTKQLRGFGASLSTVRGTVSSSWLWQQDQDYSLSVSVPIGSIANISFTSISTVEESGAVVFTDGKFVPHAVIGIDNGGRTKGSLDQIWIQVLPGTYNFTASSK